MYLLVRVLCQYFVLAARPTAHMPPSPSFVQQTTSAPYSSLPYYGARVDSVGLAQRPSLTIHRTIADKEKRRKYLQVMGKPRNQYQTLPHKSTRLHYAYAGRHPIARAVVHVFAIHGSTMPER